MQVRAGQYLTEGRYAWNGNPVFSQHNGRCAHDITARSTRILDSLNRMADHTGDTIIVERARELGSGIQRTGEQRDRVMTSFTVPGRLNPLAFVQHLDVAEIKGFAERICVG